MRFHHVRAGWGRLSGEFKDENNLNWSIELLAALPLYNKCKYYSELFFYLAFAAHKDESFDAESGLKF